jgi:hypothetical protein
MRTYYVLTHEDRDDLQSVTDYEMGGFDLTLFWSGKSFAGGIPSNVKLFLGEGAASDYLANPLSWAIVSERFLMNLKELLGNDSQYFPAHVYDEKRQPLSGINILNVTRCLDVLAGPLVSVDKIVLKEASIPSDTHLFRIIGHETLLIASEKMVQEVFDKKMQGIAFIKTSSK